MKQVVILLIMSMLMAVQMEIIRSLKPKLMINPD
jgi:hypothetical protein